MAKQQVLTRVVRRAPDDTESYVPQERQGDLLYTVDHFPTKLAERSIDSFSALQIGLWQILSALDMYSVDFKALLAGQVQSRKFRFEELFFDWAEIINDRIPVNAVVIQQAGETSYAYVDLQAALLEESEDKYCKGTVLKVMHHATVTMQCVSWLTSKDERLGVRKAIEEAFDEPSDDRAGRRVLIPEYWDQVARYTLQTIDYPDTADSATDNTWPIAARFLADIPVVKLVASPGSIRGVRTQVYFSD